MWQILLRCPNQHTSERRDANATCEEDDSSACIIGESEIPRWAFDFNCSADQHVLQYTLERRIAHARRHHQRFFVRATRNRKPSRISFRIRLRRVEQRHVNKLARFESPAGWFFKSKRDGSLGPSFRSFSLDTKADDTAAVLIFYLLPLASPPPAYNFHSTATT